MSETKTTEEPSPKSTPWYWTALGGFAVVCAAIGFIRVADGTFNGVTWVYEALERGHNSLSYQTNIASLSGRLDGLVRSNARLETALDGMHMEMLQMSTSNVFQHLNIVLLNSQVEDLSKKLARKQDAWDWSGSFIMTNMAVSNIIQFDRPSDVFIYTNGSWRNTK